MWPVSYRYFTDFRQESTCFQGGVRDSQTARSPKKSSSGAVRPRAPLGDDAGAHPAGTALYTPSPHRRHRAHFRPLTCALMARKSQHTQLSARAVWPAPPAPLYTRAGPPQAPLSGRRRSSACCRRHLHLMAHHKGAALPACGAATAHACRPAADAAHRAPSADCAAGAAPHAMARSRRRSPSVLARHRGRSACESLRAKAGDQPAVHGCAAERARGQNRRMVSWCACAA